MMLRQGNAPPEACGGALRLPLGYSTAFQKYGVAPHSVVQTQMPECLFFWARTELRPHVATWHQPVHGSHAPGLDTGVPRQRQQ